MKNSKVVRNHHRNDFGLIEKLSAGYDLDLAGGRRETGVVKKIISNINIRYNIISV